GLGGGGEQPLVRAECQGEVQRRRRGRGQVSCSVFQETGVLPAGDLDHLGYLAAYTVSNDKDKFPGRLQGRCPWESRDAGPVNFIGWFSAHPPGTFSVNPVSEYAACAGWGVGPASPVAGSG